MLYDELLQEIDIVEVIEEYVSLKQKGDSYSACCPFHYEDTPSFSVSPALQIFKCFSSECSAAGNAITFISMFEDISPNQAFINLCKKHGRTDLIDQDSKKLLKLYKTNYQVAQAYHYNLRDPRKYPEVVDYLKNRGLDFETVEQFKLGYAPPDRNFLRKSGFNDEVLEELRLLKSSNSSHKKEHFYNRVIIPFHHNGNIVGFSGRTTVNVNPKYLNTKESDIFKKKDILFGWHQNQKTIRSRKEVILVEGQFDVIGMYARDIKYAVGFAGSFMSEKAVNFLSKSVSKLTFFTDGDKAGRMAASRILMAFADKGLKLQIIYCENEDPSSLLNKVDWVEVKNKYTYAPLDFLFNYLGIEKAMEFTSSITDPFKQSRLMKDLAKLTGKQEFQLQKLIKPPVKRFGIKVIREAEHLPLLDQAIFLSEHYHVPLNDRDKKLLLSHIKSRKFRSRKAYVEHLKGDPQRANHLYEVFQKAKDPAYIDKVMSYISAEAIKVEISNLKVKYTQTLDSLILNQIQELNHKLNEQKT